MKKASIDVAFLEDGDMLSALETEERGRDVVGNLRNGADAELRKIPDANVVDFGMPGVLRVECRQDVLQLVHGALAGRMRIMVPQGRIAGVVHQPIFDEGEGI